MALHKLNHCCRKITLSKALFYDEGNFEYVHYFNQAMRAQKLFLRDVDYVVQNGKVQIVDEFTGRILDGRRYSDGLHQAIEAKRKYQDCPAQSHLSHNYLPKIFCYVR